MILQTLAAYYKSLVLQEKLDRPGWNKVKVSFALELDENGNLIRIHSLREERELGKKRVLMPREMTVPAPAKRTVGIKANFLCDNSSYFLGIDSKGKPERALSCFQAAKELHLSLLNNIETPCAIGVRRFFEQWAPQNAVERLKNDPYYEEILQGGNLVFMVGDSFPQKDPLIESAWQSAYDGVSEEDKGELDRCLITGEATVPEKIHPSVKGIPGAQSSGAALVSFNAPSFCSYGKEQNLNAPVGKQAAFAYTTALNYLIADRDHRKLFGDTTVVYWADTGETEYQDAFSVLLDCAGEGLTDRDLSDAMQKLSQGLAISWEGNMLNPDRPFYILGISPNAARLSVRFFLQSSFGEIVQHLQQHAERMKIVPDRKTDYQMIPLWRLLKATVNEKSQDKTASPKMAGETLRAILTGGRYPATLYQQVQIRIKADRQITWERMAIVKAYLLRNSTDERIKEGLTVQLNDQTTYQPYLLGRLFAVLEAIQEKATPGINATIKDKYFTSACATPSVVFPILLNLKDKHLKKLDGGIRVYYDKQVSVMNSGMLLPRITKAVVSPTPATTVATWTIKSVRFSKL
ncbi:MAG: type I-C CRISPR-associated protein Cas8c/Csd1, partial [Lachnospiraceae bacterium]|nr:type I-C CRISPR-associated protein Cas8c/Csd1 [Lachnospiraceae bacterium]